ncbi:uncharacterized protein [Zea mays]|jgi:hypothetical protein|uniref:uncharacterized protein LOC100277293 n=1 Tax=Zea mays TaxID=4577 RepID=UPI000220D95A|nr:uncharacterized protein LOC100277293 [Zea mays]XP_035818439.1 uncharacterized protein LOC118473316 [Zea mays]
MAASLFPCDFMASLRRIFPELVAMAAPSCSSMARLSLAPSRAPPHAQMPARCQLALLSVFSLCRARCWFALLAARAPLRRAQASGVFLPCAESQPACRAQPPFPLILPRPWSSSPQRRALRATVSCSLRASSSRAESLCCVPSLKFLCARSTVPWVSSSLPQLSGVWPASIRVRSYRHRRVVAGDSFACASNSRV